MTRTKTVWTANVLTLFPEMFPGPLGHSLAGKALKEDVWSLQTLNIRSFADDKHKIVDDTPFGGGAGMIMRPDIIDRALEHVSQSLGETCLPILYLTPRGLPLTQDKVKILCSGSGIVLVCGRNEGVDQYREGRIRINLLSLEFSSILEQVVSRHTGGDSKEGDQQLEETSRNDSNAGFLVTGRR